VRLFVAAEPSEDVRQRAAAAAARLRAALETRRLDHGIRWVPAEHLHLTVWFLGEVSDQRAAAALDALRPAFVSSAFTLSLAGFGAFPPSGPPRVFWIGAGAGRDELARLHDQVGERLAPWGFPAEGRAYSAHLTVARLKEPPAAAARATVRQLLRDLPAEAGQCRVDALTVFRSRTSPRGAVYEPLLRVPLG
jgi:2'-5' RNA ligase